MPKDKVCPNWEVCLKCGSLARRGEMKHKREGNTMRTTIPYCCTACGTMWDKESTQQVAKELLKREARGY